MKIRSKIINYLFDMFVRPSGKDFDVLTWCEDYLRNNGYQKNKDYYIKGFVMVKIITNEKILLSIEIKHDIPNAKAYIINKNFCTELMISNTYMQSI